MPNPSGSHHTDYRSIDATPLGDEQKLASGEAISFAGNGATGRFGAGTGTLGFHGRDLGSHAPTEGRVPAFLALAERTGGTYLENDGTLTVGEAIHRVGLDFTVRHNRLKVVETEFVFDPDAGDGGDMVERETGRLLDFEDWRATVGYPQDGGDPFPIAPTSPRYAIHQAEEALAIGDDISGGRLRAIGAFGNPIGARVYAAYELGDGFQIAGDPYRNYVTVGTSFDRSGGTWGLMAPIRLGCTNQGNATFGRKATPRFTIRHVGSATVNLEEARRILGITQTYTEVFVEQMEELLTIKMTRDDFVAYERKVFGVDLEPDTTKKRALQLAEARDEQLLAILASQTCAFGEGTAYQAFQAVTEWGNFFQPVRGRDEAATRAERLMDGRADNLIQRAYDMAAALA